MVNRVFAVAVMLIAAVSIYDAYLVFYFRVSIDEQNPFCKWLISLEPKYVSVFLLSKAIGTLGVVSILTGLFKYWRRIACPVAVSLVVFQAGLMTYLHATDGRQLNARELASVLAYRPQASSNPPVHSKKRPHDNRTLTQRRQRRSNGRQLPARQQQLQLTPPLNYHGANKRLKIRPKKRTQSPVLSVGRSERGGVNLSENVDLLNRSNLISNWQRDVFARWS